MREELIWSQKTIRSSDDTLKFGRITDNGISLLVGASVRFWKFDIGANTDLFALAFGVKRRGLVYQIHICYEGMVLNSTTHMLKAIRATAFNVVPWLLDNRTGSRKYFFGTGLPKGLDVKLGYVHGRVTYTASEKLDNGQKRFSVNYGVPYAALSFPFIINRIYY